MKTFLIQALTTMGLRLALLALGLARMAVSLALAAGVFMTVTQALGVGVTRFEASVAATVMVALLVARWALGQAQIAILRRYFEPTIGGVWRASDLERQVDHFDPREPYSGCTGPTQFNISLGRR